MNKNIFISYAWEEDKDEDTKVKDFAQWLAVYLKKWGFSVSLDIFENRPGTNLEKYMQEGINSSRYLICICTETYVKKMENEGTGVNKEINLLKKMAQSPFVIPVIENNNFQNLPEIFKEDYVSKLVFKNPFSSKNEIGMTELIKTLREESITLNQVKPETSVEKYFDYTERINFKDKITKLMHYEVKTEGTVSFRYLLNGGDFTIGIPPMDFVTHWSTADADTIWSYKKVSTLMSMPNFNNFEQIKTPDDLNLDNMTSIDRSVKLKIGDGLVWINQENIVAVGKVVKINLDREHELKSTVTIKYKILNPIELTDEFVSEVNM